MTAGAAFKTSMASMIAELNAKIPSYIRCIKPNEKKRPNQFDAKLVLNQGRRSAKDRRNDVSSVCRQFGTSVSSRTFVFAERVSAIACRRINFSNGIGEMRVVPRLTLFFSTDLSLSVLTRTRCGLAPSKKASTKFFCTSAFSLMNISLDARRFS